MQKDYKKTLIEVYRKLQEVAPSYCVKQVVAAKSIIIDAVGVEEVSLNKEAE